MTNAQMPPGGDSLLRPPPTDAELRGSGQLAPFQLGVERQPEGIDFARYIEILLARKWLIIFSVVVGLAAGFVVTLRETPLYRASALIQAVPPPTSPFGYRDYSAMMIAENFTGDQIQLLKSSSFARTVSESLRLNLGETRPQKSAAEATSSFFAALRSDVMGLIERLRGDEAGGESAALPEVPLASAESRRNAIANEIKSSLSVSPVSRSNLLQLSIVSTDPNRAAELVNAVAKTYVGVATEQRYQGSSETKEFYDEQIRKTRLQLEDLEKKMVQYAREKDLVDLDNLLLYHESEYSALQTQLFAAEQQLYAAEAKFTAMRDGGGLFGEEVLNSPTIADLKTRRGELQDEYQRRLEVYLPEYPEMQQLRRQIQAIDSQIQLEAASIGKSVEVGYVAAQREYAAIAARVAEQRNELMRIRDETADFNAIKRERDTLQAVYDGLLERVKEAAIVGEVRSRNIAIIDLAGVPSQPFSPDLEANLTKGLMFGLIAGLGFVVLGEKLDDTVKSGDDIEKEAFLPVLGGVPFLGRSANSPSSGEVAFASLKDPKGPVAEAFRSLRTSLMLSSTSGAPSPLHLTSAGPGEGKSVTAAGMAVSFAQSGCTVLCIDTDFRNPSQHRIFDLPNDHGLSTYLVTEGRAADVAQWTSVDGLFVMTSGPLPPNPVELLASQKLRDLVSLATERFDYVLIDGPPVIGLADALVLAGVAGSTLLVVEPGQTRKAALRDSLKRLRMGNARLVGVVLQKLGQHAGATGYGYGYGYGSKYHYQYLYGYGDNLPEQGRRRWHA